MDSDNYFMSLAIALGQKGRLSAPPNPWVGCVIVKDHQIVGEGFHESLGKPHAEVVALEQAGSKASGATLYCTLEPCNHYGRTPPCTTKILQSGIKKVVIPFEDPDEKVAGKGIQLLKSHGIEVIVGVGKSEAEYALKPYLIHRKTGMPFCVLKAASSLDGRVAAENGTSQWITGEKARQDVHYLRAESQAILVGSKTALKDNPKLTVRGIVTKHCQPLRVVLDSSGSLHATGNLFEISQAPTLIFTTAQCSALRIEEWHSKNIEVECVSQDDQGRVDLKEVLNHLGKRGIIQLFVEGGAQVHGSFLHYQLWHRYVHYLGACVLGPKGLPLISSLTPQGIDQAPRWNIEEVQRFDNDLKIVYSR